MDNLRFNGLFIRNKTPQPTLQMPTSRFHHPDFVPSITIIAYLSEIETITPDGKEIITYRYECPDALKARQLCYEKLQEHREARKNNPDLDDEIRYNGLKFHMLYSTVKKDFIDELCLVKGSHMSTEEQLAALDFEVALLRRHICRHIIKKDLQGF